MAVPLLIYLALRARAITPSIPAESGEGSDLLRITDLVQPATSGIER
jgi:hypothetical protein